MPKSEPLRDLKLEFIKAPAIAAQLIDPSIMATVEAILAEVRRDGDSALRRFSKSFDGADIEEFEVGDSERKKAVHELDGQTRADTEFAIAGGRLRRLSSPRSRPCKPSCCLGCTSVIASFR
jgi:histidinol dehydrogenase